MNKKFTSTLLASILAISFVGCTSRDSKSDDQVAATDDSASVDQELEKLDGEEALQAKNSDESVAGFSEEKTPDQATDQSTPSPDTPPPSSDIAATDGASGPDMTPPPDTSMSDVNPPATPDLSASSEPKPKASFKKDETTPFKKGGQLLNAVYHARPGDTYAKIATMIYGSDEKEKMLKKANPSISKPKPGDKIYYNSPQRPTDDTIVKNYYEDNNIAPQNYVGQNGDNLKKVAKELLGYDQAWKEIWATNPIDSKSKLEEGVVIKYWPGSASAAAAPQGGSSSSEMAQAPAPGADASAPPAPPMDQAQTPGGFGAGTQASPDLPPPPPPMDNGSANGGGGFADSGAGAGSSSADLPPPPPPPSMSEPAMSPAMKSKTAQQDNDELMLGLAAVGILVAGGAALIIIRKRRQQKAMANAFNDTQIGAG